MRTSYLRVRLEFLRYPQAVSYTHLDVYKRQSLRRAHGLRQQPLADALAAAGVPVSNQAVSKWENDATLPNAQQMCIRDR